MLQPSFDGIILLSDAPRRWIPDQTRRNEIKNCTVQRVPLGTRATGHTITANAERFHEPSDSDHTTGHGMSAVAGLPGRRPSAAMTGRAAAQCSDAAATLAAAAIHIVKRGNGLLKCRSGRPRRSIASRDDALPVSTLTVSPLGHGSMPRAGN